MLAFVLKPLPPLPEGFTGIPRFRCIPHGKPDDMEATTAFRLATVIQDTLDCLDVFAVLEKQTETGSVQIHSDWSPAKEEWQPWSPI